MKKNDQSPAETLSGCEKFGECGGCAYQNISYKDELILKENYVKKLLDDSGIAGYEYRGIIPAEDTAGYRNKMEFSFGNSYKNGPLNIGMRKRGRRYDVVSAGVCAIVDADFRRILRQTEEYFRRTGEEFYRTMSRQGVLRHLVIRKGFFTGEILINLVTTSALAGDLTPWVRELNGLNLDGVISGILHTINDGFSDAVKCDNLAVLQGRDFFMEKLLGLEFQITPFSFFQTNSGGAEKLYTLLLELAGKHKSRNILDLYCGGGVIGQIMGKYAENSSIKDPSGGPHILGVELVPEAVEAARAGARANNIRGCCFIQGNVLQVLDSLTEKPCLIILDPPREGVHPKALSKIAVFNAERIIYVSCQPKSLARDLAFFSGNGYRAKEMGLVDLFPRTAHTEAVILLENTNN